MMRRVFLLEVLACACGGRRRVVAVLEQGPAARKILAHLGLLTSGSPVEPSRVSQGELWPTGPPASAGERPVHDELCQRLPPHLDDA